MIGYRELLGLLDSLAGESLELADERRHRFGIDVSDLIAYCRDYADTAQTLLDDEEIPLAGLVLASIDIGLRIAERNCTCAR